MTGARAALAALVVLVVGCHEPPAPAGVPPAVHPGRAGVTPPAPPADRRAAAPRRRPPRPAREDPTRWGPTPGSEDIGSLAGVVTVRARPSRPRHLEMDDPDCAAHHATAIPDPAVVVARDGRVANAFVWIDRGLERWTGEAPRQPVRIDQRGCLFLPRVVGLRVGQPLIVRNGDPVVHNVAATPTHNKAFNIMQTDRGQQTSLVFQRPEVVVELRCFLHRWMVAYVGVVGHPFHAVTDRRGAFQWTALPAGRYRVSVWHERLGRTSAAIRVTPAGPMRVALQLPGRRVAEFD